MAPLRGSEPIYEQSVLRPPQPSLEH